MGIKETASNFLDQCVREVAQTKPIFTSDDVWDVFTRDGGFKLPIEKRAMGPAMSRAVRAGLCIKRDKVVKSHRRRQGLSQSYRSTLVETPKMERIVELTAEIEELRVKIVQKETELQALQGS